MIKIAGIYIAFDKGRPMRAIEEALLLESAGILGDRYATAEGSWNAERKGKRQVSIMSVEALIEGNRRLGNPFEPHETRRNIFLRNMPNDVLNSLSSVKVQIGEALLVGDKYCDPCARPNVLSGKHGFREAFHDKAGFLFKVVTGGLIKVDDKVEILNA